MEQYPPYMCNSETNHPRHVWARPRPGGRDGFTTVLCPGNRPSPDFSKVEEFVDAARADIVRVSEEALKEPGNLATALRYWLLHDATKLSIPEAIEAWGTVVVLQKAALAKEGTPE